MNYRDYVIAAYLVFALILLWDFVVPRMQVRAALRAATLRANRVAPPPDKMELER
ncbi:MAG: heme exporter protein CcmD [Thermomonas sp.]